MTELVAIHYSPWSERARWALDHHRVSYREREHLPMLGEPALRLRARRFRGRITVPILFARGETLADSFDIARWAEANGAGEPLFPKGRLDDVKRWNDASERALASGRVMSLQRVSQDQAAQLEAIPRAVPQWIRRFGGALTRSALTWMSKKYRFDDEAIETRATTLEAVMREVQKALSGHDYLLDDRFSYADVTMACGLQLVSPVGDEFIRIGKATRACCTDRELVAKYREVIDWRDALYRKHRRRP